MKPQETWYVQKGWKLLALGCAGCMDKNGCQAPLRANEVSGTVQMVRVFVQGHSEVLGFLCCASLLHP